MVYIPKSKLKYKIQHGGKIKMQKLTRTEIQWIISALNHQNRSLESIIASGSDTTLTNLFKLDIENNKSVINKLDKALAGKDKRISIE